ncbi:MAG: response regulator [Caulobacterales bacterium]|nr:response regulator [Caulobacterales bacterium]
MSAHKPRVLVIDDEPRIHRFLGPALGAAGYEPIRADTAAEGLREIARKAPDAVVLDLGLPDLDGKEALVKARAFYEGPIIILSARDKETEKIDALDLGADDYVEKPFGVGELLARLRVALRHRLRDEGAMAATTVGDLTVDLVKRLVTRAGEPIRLSPREYDVLAQLVKGGGKVVTHRQLLTAVWGPAHEQDVQYLRVFVAQLRQKIEPDPSEPSLILTEPSIGYRWMA